jgi:hypothetical protein
MAGNIIDVMPTSKVSAVDVHIGVSYTHVMTIERWVSPSDRSYGYNSVKNLMVCAPI